MVFTLSSKVTLGRGSSGSVTPQEIPSPPCSPGPPGNSRQAGKPSRLVASWVNKFCLAYLKQCVEILCMAAEKPWAGYFGCGKPWPGCFGRGKTLGGLFWLRKNRAGAILAAEKPCARAHSGILPYRLCIFDT